MKGVLYVLAGLDFEGRRRRRHLRLLREAAAATAPGRQASRERLPESERKREERRGALVTLGGIGPRKKGPLDGCIDLCFLYASLMGHIWAVWFAFLFGLIWFGEKWADKTSGLLWFGLAVCGSQPFQTDELTRACLCALQREPKIFRRENDHKMVLGSCLLEI